MSRYFSADLWYVDTMKYNEGDLVEFPASPELVGAVVVVMEQYVDTIGVLVARGVGGFPEGGPSDVVYTSHAAARKAGWTVAGAVELPQELRERVTRRIQAGRTVQMDGEPAEAPAGVRLPVFRISGWKLLERKVMTIGTRLAGGC